MLTMGSSRIHRFLTVFFVLAVALGIVPGSAWAVDTELAAESLASENNGIPILTLTIDPDEFQKVVMSPDHSYRAECGTISIDVPNGYSGEFSETELEGIENAALEYVRGRSNSSMNRVTKMLRLSMNSVS